MKSLWQALNVMWTLHHEGSPITKTGRAASLLTIKSGLGAKTTSIDHYEPHIKCRGTIVVFHGMSKLGKEDPRIISLCQALSQVGFRVICPEISSIRDLNIDPEQIDEMIDILMAVIRHPHLSESGKLSILAPSFSGGMCLQAAADERIRDNILSVCAIGPYTDVTSVLNYLLTDEDADPYGRYIILKKLLPMLKDELSSQHIESLTKALDAAITDNINESTELDCQNKAEPGSRIELTRFQKTLNQEESALLQLILRDANYRTSVLEKVKSALEFELEKLNIISSLDALKARVLLVHGIDDRVIPCEQSEKLYHNLKSKQKQVDLVLTPFISHGDTSFSLSQLPDIFRIVKGFQFFFQAHDAVQPS